jgi:hypothetical protein
VVIATARQRAEAARGQVSPPRPYGGGVGQRRDIIGATRNPILVDGDRGEAVLGHGISCGSIGHVFPHFVSW